MDDASAESNPYIVPAPNRPVPAGWHGPVPWSLTSRTRIHEWREAGWHPRALLPGELIGSCLLAGTLCATRHHCDMTFVPGVEGGLVICDDCGHAMEADEHAPEGDEADPATN